MDRVRLYRSKKGEIYDYYTWYHIAREFYNVVQSDMPHDWWQRWWNVLELKEVFPARHV